MKKMYVTCKGKGGLYLVFPNSTGAGTSRGQTLVVYQDVVSQEVYHRTEEDFRERMEEVEVTQECERCDGDGFSRDGEDCFPCGGSGRSSRVRIKQ